MSKDLITCPLCGTRFDPAGHIACQSCPLQKGCHLICCPKCGYQMVDLEGSAIVHTLDKLMTWTGFNRSDTSK